MIGEKLTQRSKGVAGPSNSTIHPDLDDTAVVAWAMQQSQDPRYGETVQRAADWICGMQSKNGGFSSFDSNNTHYYLNEIPFADHGALLDPPTSDVSARCAALLAQLNQHHDELKACLDLRPGAGKGRFLVWVLGHQLHLRHMVGASCFGDGR